MGTLIVGPSSLWVSCVSSEEYGVGVIKGEGRGFYIGERTTVYRFLLNGGYLSDYVLHKHKQGEQVLILVLSVYNNTHRNSISKTIYISSC